MCEKDIVKTYGIAVTNHAVHRLLERVLKIPRAIIAESDINYYAYKCSIAEDLFDRYDKKKQEQSLALSYGGIAKMYGYVVITVIEATHNERAPKTHRHYLRGKEVEFKSNRSRK